MQNERNGQQHKLGLCGRQAGEGAHVDNAKQLVLFPKGDLTPLKTSQRATLENSLPAPQVVKHRVTL